MARKGYPSDKQDQFIVDLGGCGRERSLQTDDKYVARFPDGLRDRLKAAASANHRSMNSEIVARLLASFGDTEEEIDRVDLKAGREAKQIKHRFPTWMHDAIKASADANGRSMNAEIVTIIASALNGRDERMDRIEAKLDRLLAVAEEG